MNVSVLLARVICFGFFIYFASFFLLDSSQQKTIFYVLVALPVIFSASRLRELCYPRLPSFWILAFIAYLVLSSTWAGTGLAGIGEALKYGLYLLCLMFAVKIVCDEFQADYMVTLVACLGAAVYIFYLFLIVFHDQAIDGWLAHRSSLMDISGKGEDNPISSAIVLGLPVLALWAIFPDKRKWMQVALLLLILLGFGLMFLTKSRGPIVALFFTLLLLSLYRRKIEDVILMVVLLLTTIGVFLCTDVSDVMISRAVEPNYRLEIWSGALQLIRGDWLFGQGFGYEISIKYGETIATHSHSTFLEILRVGGVVGALLFFGMIFFVFKSCFFRGVNIFFVFWIVYGFLSLSTNGRLPLSRPAIEWFAFWLPLFFMLFAGRCSKER